MFKADEVSVNSMKPEHSRVNHNIDHWVMNTRLCREWEVTKQEILRHKWYESEKAGHDIGWDRAALDWMIRFRPRRSTSS